MVTKKATNRIAFAIAECTMPLSLIRGKSVVAKKQLVNRLAHFFSVENDRLVKGFDSAAFIKACNGGV